MLDLRGNAGGLLTAAVETCDLFLPQGRIVSTRGRGGSIRRAYEASQDHVLSRGIPVVVLVNKHSASASEIVAACLQDHGRAVIVGERTWGKGTVQNLLELEGGLSALRLTTASYWRPSGRNIHRREAESEDAAWGVRPNEGFSFPLNDEETKRVMALRRAQDLRAYSQQPSIEEPSAEEPSAEEPSAEESNELESSGGREWRSGRHPARSGSRIPQGPAFANRLRGPKRRDGPQRIRVTSRRATGRSSAARKNEPLTQMRSSAVALPNVCCHAAGGFGAVLISTGHAAKPPVTSSASTSNSSTGYRSGVVYESSQDDLIEVVDRLAEHPPDVLFTRRRKDQPAAFRAAGLAPASPARPPSKLRCVPSQRSSAVSCR